MGLGSVCTGPALELHLKGSSASRETTQGEILVAKFLAVNGPRGTYSHAYTTNTQSILAFPPTIPIIIHHQKRHDSLTWISRADQSFMTTTPKMRSSAFSMGIGSPSGLGGPPKQTHRENSNNHIPNKDSDKEPYRQRKPSPTQSP